LLLLFITLSAENNTVNLVPVLAMKAYVGVDLYLHTFLTLALDARE
jgi:hypothetical protein